MPKLLGVALKITIEIYVSFLYLLNADNKRG